MEAVSLFTLLFVVWLASGHYETSEAEMSKDTESSKRAETGRKYTAWQQPSSPSHPGPSAFAAAGSVGGVPVSQTSGAVWSTATIVLEDCYPLLSTVWRLHLPQQPRHRHTCINQGRWKVLFLGKVFLYLIWDPRIPPSAFPLWKARRR